MLLSLAAAAQTLVSLQLDPPVMVPGSTQTVAVQVRVAGTATRVTFESALQPGTEVNMRDDGGGIYTIALPAAPILAAMRPDDVYRPLLGFARAYNGTVSAGRFNILAEVADPKIPRLPVVSDAADVQHTDYVVNILSPQSFPSNADPAAIPGQSRVANRFYSLFPDAFDVINVVYVPSFFQNRFHYQVRNAVRGIGLSIFNNGASYGSSSRLQGISVFPISTFFDGADTGVQHEFGHQWINYLNVPPVAAGIPHWPLSTMASGTMGYSIVGGEGGTFQCTIVPDSSGVRLVGNTNQPMFGDMDLYLMGLLPANQVREQIVLGSQDPSFVVSQCNGSIYSGAFTRLNVSDLIANPSIGPRIPDAAQSPKQFRLATILVTRDSLLSPEAMSFYSFFAQRMELETAAPIHQGLSKATGYPFAISARGLGSMVARVTSSAAPSPPFISEVVNGASFLPGIAEGAWVTIKGSNLASTPRIWTDGDFAGNNLPTSLDGVSVMIDNHPAYVYYISPTQLNVLAPADATLGPVPVQVTWRGLTSTAATVTLAAFAPALFAFTPQGGKYVAAVRSDGPYLGPANLIPGVATVAAHPGDTILLFGTGFGASEPASPIGTIITPAPVANPVTVTIGGVPATVVSYLISPGLYQFNVTVPNSAAGDNLVVLKVSGVASQANAFLWVQ